MTGELGKVEKPAAERFAMSRKIYLVPLVVCGKDAPPELAEKCRRYWEQVRLQVDSLELKAGKIGKIYHESIVVAGEDGLKIMERFNPEGSHLTRDKCAKGAAFELIEDRALAEEALDWERCLMQGLASEAVAGKISGFYQEASRLRYDHMANRISATLSDREAGLLFISQGHRLQFPRDIEVFIVSPPAFDELQRWLREEAERGEPHQHDETCNHDK
jgi:hypothetical protein